MHQVKFFAFLNFFVLVLAGTLSAAQLNLTDGSVVTGELVPSFNDQGLVIRLETGSYSERIPWSKLTQETLKELSKNRAAKPFAEPYIEQPLEEKQKAKKKEIVVKPVTSRLERLHESPGMIGALSTPAGLLVLLVLLVANIYAGYEIAVYRNQPVAVVCAVSAFVPVLGPVIFLSLPTRPQEAGEVEGVSGDQFAGSHPSVSPAAVSGEATGSLTSRMKNKITSAFQHKPAAGLSIATQTKGSKGAVETKTYRRPEYTFNRRFIETQFPGFFRVVPSESEKDLVLVVKAGRAEYVARRISRISASDMHVQMQSGAAEAAVPLGDIIEIQVRHKDAKP